ncbi:hypothetical protein CEXT_334611 [Caerostris extrusa]|uniref:Uncharacterized protein n=1 Tax=Caerostris extrusa TaxID=172846 RepID=A0AAV4VVE1_CAEEX|nr:hypothetical protein CEXT_334611 [Caerostris extrusa]
MSLFHGERKQWGYLTLKFLFDGFHPKMEEFQECEKILKKKKKKLGAGGEVESNLVYSAALIGKTTQPNSCHCFYEILLRSLT